VNGIAGRRALVTGAGAGIGRACAVALAEAGASAVGIAYRGDAEGAAETARLVESAGAVAVLLPVDLAVEGAADELAATASERLGPVQLLVNNAAYTRMVAPGRLTAKLWRAQFRVNLDAAFELTWALRPGMAAAGGGAVVNISSTSARVPNPALIAYGATKAALEAFTASAGLAFLDEGIRINAVAPGLTATPRVDTVDEQTRSAMLTTVPMGRMGEPAEVAAAVRFLLSDEASYITGQTITVSGGV
jgi:NAD(P)-dependent dehydrogenase (short-subunit alcohol dehydrogenase family)